MSIDNENDAMDAENNPGTAGVATAPSLDDLDAAMAALIRAASPSESTQAQSSLEPNRSGPAMALVNSVSIMDEDDDDFFDDDEEEESQEAAPPAAQQRANTPAPIPFRTPQPQAQEQQPPQQPQYAQPQPQPAVQNEYVAPQPQQQTYSAPQAAPQQEYMAPQTQAQPEQPAQTAPQAAPQQQSQPLPQQASAPQTVPYQQPVAQQNSAAAAQNQAPQSSVPQHARATLMHETNQDKHLHDASKYISTWLAQNTNDEEVIEAAMDWARKHKTAEHNGNVIASLLILEKVDNEVTVMAVRWLTHHSMHNLAPQIVTGLTRRQQQQ